MRLSCFTWLWPLGSRPGTLMNGDALQSGVWEVSGQVPAFFSTIVRLRSRTWSHWASWGDAAEAGYLAGRRLHDQQKIKIPSWDSISDSLFLRCSLPTWVVVPNFKKSVFPRFVRKVGEVSGNDHRRFHQVSSDPSLRESLVVMCTLWIPLLYCLSYCK